MKSLNLFTPLVRIKRSSGGSPAVNRRSSIVSEDIVSGSGYIVSSRISFGGDSGCRVVDDDTESSWSDVFDGVGELARSDESRLELVSFVDRIFCEILVWEKGRACVGMGFE